MNLNNSAAKERKKVLIDDVLVLIIFVLLVFCLLYIGAALHSQHAKKSAGKTLAIRGQFIRKISGPKLDRFVILTGNPDDETTRRRSVWFEDVREDPWTPEPGDLVTLYYVRDDLYQGKHARLIWISPEDLLEDISVEEIVNDLFSGTR